jgi:hypothetical protein
VSNKAYSRSQVEQIKARIRRALELGHEVWHSTKCLICGKPFHSSQCTHSYEENLAAWEKFVTVV